MKISSIIFFVGAFIIGMCLEQSLFSVVGGCVGVFLLTIAPAFGE